MQQSGSTVAEGSDLKQFKPGDVIAGRYEVTEHLGSGLLGATYLARNVQSNKFLAIKFIRPVLLKNPKDRARFDKVFQAAREIKNEKIVRYGDVLEHEGLVCFTEEYFKSQSLRQLIQEYQKDGRSFTLQEACQIVVQVLEAVQALHDAGIVHRSLKPENVLVASRATGPNNTRIVRTVKISDAGLTDMLSPTIFAESYVNRGEQRYMAPELAGFEHAGVHASDIYSVGVMLYELLVGQTPRGTYLSPTQLREDLPDHVDDIVEIALDANPEGRYPTARDMINDIQRSFSIEAQNTGEPAVSMRTAVFAMVAILVVVASAFIYYSTVGDTDPAEVARIADIRVRNEVKTAMRLPSAEEMEVFRQRRPDMVYIPPGPFIMGRMNGEELASVASASEALAVVTELPGYYIDRFEFPNATQDKSGNPVKPVGRVTYDQAAETCTRVGKRLCTEAEWEKACKGPENYIYSYGDTFDETKCGKTIDEAYNIGDRTGCISGYGAADLSGGLREWTSTPAGTKGNRRVVKGGFRANHQRGSRCAFSLYEAVGYADGTLSFRCCMDVNAAPGPASTEGASTGGTAPQ